MWYISAANGKRRVSQRGSGSRRGNFFGVRLERTGKCTDGRVSLSGALRKVGSLPTLFVDMVSMGEQTGRLGYSLEKIATRYDKELNKKIKRLTELITPVILILMFVIVGVVAYAIVSSIFQAMSGIKR